MLTHPIWLKRRVIENDSTKRINGLLGQRKIRTVCSSANCPNIFECFSRNKLTFLILGDVCTRRCNFCSVKKALPKEIDDQEPYNIRDSVSLLRIEHAVITSVTRDDLTDGGAMQFKRTVDAIKTLDRNITVEALTPDFKAKPYALDCVLDSQLDIFAHNIETVPRLYPLVRLNSDYKVSLDLLMDAKKKRPSLKTKTSVMVGLGETKDEVRGVLSDIINCGCDIITIGQYLRPNKNCINVKEFVSPEMFEEYEVTARQLGFLYVASGPFVRSSNYLPR